MAKIIDILKEKKVYAIIREKNPQLVEKIAKALIEGGVKVLEIAILSNEIFEVITEISKLKPDVIICAGSIITGQTAKKAILSGAKAISSPVYQTSMIKLCLSYKIPLILSASTPNECYNAWIARTPITKLFPAKALGGPEYIFDVIRQMPFLNLVPSGGIELDEAAGYIKAGAVAVGLGRALWKDADSNEITNRALYLLSQLK